MERRANRRGKLGENRVTPILDVGATLTSLDPNAQADSWTQLWSPGEGRATAEGVTEGVTPSNQAEAGKKGTPQPGRQDSGGLQAFWRGRRTAVDHTVKTEDKGNGLKVSKAS